MRSQSPAALLCIALFSACAQEGVVGNTDIRLTIGTEFGPQDGEAAFEADRVDYRITCAGSAGDFAHFANKYMNLNPMNIQGQNANDVIWANSGDDFLDGGNGNDTPDGGPGNDVILGGAGQDEITMGYDNGIDSVFGGPGTDRLSLDALACQITIAPAGNAGYQFDIFYLGTWIAQVAQTEELSTMDASIDLMACIAGACNLCGDGVLNGGEECDDGNLADSDGCASDCTQE